MRANTGFQSASDQKADSSETVLHCLDEVGQRRVEAFTALAHQMAWKAARFYACDMPADELVAEALLGLTYASCLFDEERGVPFGAYATMVIRHRLIHAVRSWRQAKRPKRMPAPKVFVL